MAVQHFLVRDEEIVPRRLPRPRIFRDRTNPLDIYDDVDVLRRFRIPRYVIFDVIDLIQQDIEPMTKRNHAIPATLQTLCTLRYYATGSFQKVSGDVIGISQSSVSRIVNKVSRAISGKAHRIIRFPRTREEQRRTIQGFYETTRFPNTIGCVDGSLIRIKSPREDENVYVCRKGYHALNIQGICDYRRRFISMVARWPGSCHDAFIWNYCGLNRDFENDNIEGHLLGDSAYPLRPWLMTPVARPQNNAEERYNRSHRHTRQMIECTYGRWKMRWLAIHDHGGALTLAPDRCVNVIVATAVLHNICEEQGIPLPPDVPNQRVDNPDDDVNPPINNVLPNDGRLARDALIMGHFNR